MLWPKFFLFLIRAGPTTTTTTTIFEFISRGPICHFSGKSTLLGHTPVRLGLSGRNSGKIPERHRKRSQSFSLEFPSRVRLGCPKPCNSRPLRLPEHFQNPPSTAGGASFFRSGSGEGLSEPVMEFPAVLGAFLIIIGPHLFLGKVVWTNDPESFSKVSPYTGIGPWMALPGFGGTAR